MRDIRRVTTICLWAVLWGVGIGLLKLIVFLFHGFHLSPAYLTGSVASFFGNIFWGILIGFLLFSKSRLIQYFGYAVAFVIVIFYISCFHYELFFGTLPGSDLLYYLKELSYLAPSLKSNAPLGFLLFEVVFGSVLIFGGAFVVGRLGPKFHASIPGFVFSAGILILSICIPALLHLFPSIFSNDAFYLGSRNPIFWLAHSSLISASKNQKSFTPLQIWEFQKALGHKTPSSGTDPNYPLCSNSRGAGASSFDKRNVILIILESVGNKEIFMKINQTPLMPNLAKIGDNGLFFENFSASGTKSNQVLPAIFSGIPPQTYNNILWRKPLPKLEGLPALLRDHGYQTAYFHGSDLSFEQQRSFLKMVGFEHIFDYDPLLEKKVSGWGYDDREMFLPLENWIEHLPKPNDPYFATLFTLSTHDPFLLPPDWKASFTQNRSTLRENGTWIGVTPLEDRYDLFLESLHFIDHEIGKFYDWYLESEKSKGTLLVILSDHVTSLHNEAADIGKRHMRFLVPLIFDGLSDEELIKFRKYTSRRGTQYDLPATIAEFLGIEPFACDQGINLFMDQDLWPKDRLVYSVGGPNLEKVYFWTDRTQLVFDRIKNRFNVANYEIPYNIKPYSPQEVKKVIDNKILPFMDILFPLNKYLLLNDAYSPSDSVQPEKGNQVLKKSHTPIFVSHRGNTSGMRKAERQNKRGAIEKAISEGFEWVDVHLTKDGIPVLIHDAVLVDASGNKLTVGDTTLQDLISVPGYTDLLTLEEALDLYLGKISFAIEVKSQRMIDKNLVLNRKILDLIKDNPLKHKIIVDSFNELAAKFIKNRCDCQVGLDTPYKKHISKEMLKAIRFAGLDWIYVHYSVVNKKLIEDAHEIGLRVMAYTVNDTDTLEQWQHNMPDGIITDKTQIKKDYMRLYPHL